MVDVNSPSVPLRKVALLGAQHAKPTLRGVLDDAGMDGPLVLVAAGWEEREAETGALEEHLGKGVQNLGAWPACESAFERDVKLRDLMFSRYDRMRELRRIYHVRLNAELAALRDLLVRTDPAAPDDLVGPALAPAFAALRDLDAHHCARIAELNDETFAAARKSEALKADTDRMGELLAGAGTLLIAGGHVGILYNRMRLFQVTESLNPKASIAGWSAGAMVLTDQIILFHDSPPRGAGDAEVHGPGFGLAPGITALPHASSRLNLEDAARVSILSRRLAPSKVVALDDGQSVLQGSATESTPGNWSLGEGVRLLQPDGTVRSADGPLPVGASQ